VIERSGILVESQFPFKTASEAMGKEMAGFTKEDVKKFIYDNGFEMLNFRFVAGDGRLKTFSFVTHDKKHIDRVLSAGSELTVRRCFPGWIRGAATSTLCRGSVGCG